MKNDLVNDELFGNEAGEDEDLELLSNYFLAKPSFDNFYSKRKKFQIVRAKKGVGKSALLVHTMYKNKLSNNEDLHIYVKGADLIAMQDVKSDSPNDFLYGWQQRICSRINLELGSTLKLAFSDDKITLIESAEVAGFRGRNLIGSLLDRMRVKGGDIELGRDKVVQADAEALLRRVSEKKEVNVWLYVDDIDATFINNEHERLKASTFFSACRNLVNSVNGLKIRISVRSDVWTILAQHDEALDKCEQYMLDLNWSTAETGEILKRKILTYFKLTYPEKDIYKNYDLERNSRQIFNLVFREPFRWNGKSMESFRPIHILSAGRPRWASQLCKLGGKAANASNKDFITIGHLTSKLKVYGQARLNDLYREHRHQCPKMENVLESFSGLKARYSTEKLLKHITENIIKNYGIPHVDGIVAPNGSIGIAHFLYRTGFICARDDAQPGSLGFIRFEERPNLLSSQVNLDDGLPWEIHPSYREVLRIKSGSN